MVASTDSRLDRPMPGRLKALAQSRAVWPLLALTLILIVAGSVSPARVVQP